MPRVVWDYLVLKDAATAFVASAHIGRDHYSQEYVIAAIIALVVTGIIYTLRGESV